MFFSTLLDEELNYER